LYELHPELPLIVVPPNEALTPTSTISVWPPAVSICVRIHDSPSRAAGSWVSPSEPDHRHPARREHEREGHKRDGDRGSPPRHAVRSWR